MDPSSGAIIWSQTIHGIPFKSGCYEWIEFDSKKRKKNWVKFKHNIIFINACISIKFDLNIYNITWLYIYVYKNILL